MSNSADTTIDWPGFLKHMQGVEKRMKKDFNEKIDALATLINRGFGKMNERFDEIEKRLEHLEEDVFILIVRTKAMHEQLQTIKKEKLPKIRKSVRKVNKRLKEQKVIASPALAKA